MNLEKYKESKQKLVELKEQQAVMCKEACEAATGDLKKEIKSLEIENKKQKALQQEKNAQAFMDAAPKIADIFKMCFLLYTIKGVDLHPQLTNHVQWIELRHLKLYINFEGDSISYDDEHYNEETDSDYSFYYRFAKDDDDENYNIFKCYNGGIDRAHEVVKCIYDKNFKEPI